MKPFFVIARYNEDVSWLFKRHYLSNGVIYNKGSDDISYAGKIVQSSNHPVWGRESETYLRYIIDHYDNLPEYIIFTQANPFGHSPNFLEILDELYILKNWKSYQALTSGCFDPMPDNWKKIIHYNDHGHPQEGDQLPPLNNILYDKTEYIKTYPIYFQLMDSSMETFPFKDLYFFPTVEAYRKYHHIFLPTNTLGRTYRMLNIKKPFCGYGKFNWGAIFGVAKTNILQHPIEFYHNLHTFSMEHYCHGYILERMWYTIFN